MFLTICSYFTYIFFLQDDETLARRSLSAGACAEGGDQSRGRPIGVHRCARPPQFTKTFTAESGRC